MDCDCSRLAYGAVLLAPFECKTILGPFDRAFVLTDVVFDLYNHPNGFNSKGCGFVWNVTPNSSRLLLGGTVDDRGRQYHLQSGILCPRRSYLSVCNCFFVAEPTALVSARVTGCYCAPPPFDLDEVVEDLPTDVVWKDTSPSPFLGPIDPTETRPRTSRPVHRELLSTGYEAIESGPLLVSGADREVHLQPGSAVALRVNRRTWRLSEGGRQARANRGPTGMDLLVVRRSADGLLIHWAAYREKRG
jgi:hypothetical protein